jgi:hypothetical protein
LIFRINSVKVYRWFRYFQQGFSLLGLPLTIINFATIFYYLLVEKIPTLISVFPNYIIFLASSLIVFLPLSILLGWYYTKRSKVYGSEMVLLTEVNPLGVHSSRLGCEQQLDILKALNIEPNPEYLKLADFWRKLDEDKRWRP